MHIFQFAAALTQHYDSAADLLWLLTFYLGNTPTAKVGESFFIHEVINGEEQTVQSRRNGCKQVTPAFYNSVAQ